MPKKALFTEEEILEAAFQIFEQEGMGSISARRIATALNSSTAPVYTGFASIDEIKAKLLERSLQILTDYTHREYTDGAFLNIGLGMLEFAKRYKLIYRALFLESNEYQYVLTEFTERNLKQMQKEPELQLLSETDLRDVLSKLTVYTHGLAALICANMLQDVSLPYLLATLQDVGNDIIGATMWKRGKLNEYLSYQSNL